MSAGPKIALCPDLCKLIASWVPDETLPALCLSSKAFLRPAQARLFYSLYFSDLSEIAGLCREINASERLGDYPRNLFIVLETLGSIRLNSAARIAAWQDVALGLKHMPNLKNLLISDAVLVNTWIFEDLGTPPFQLKNLKLRFQWDQRFVDFLSSQKSVVALETSCPDPYIDLSGSSPDGTPTHIILPTIPVDADSDGFLPHLARLETQLFIAQQLLTPFPGRKHYPPLTYIRINPAPENDRAVLSMLPNLCWVHKSLRAINVQLPEDVVWKAINMIATAVPTIRYIGVLHIPSVHHHRLTSALLRLPHLWAVEIDVSSWEPQPPNLFAQRAFAATMRTYAPSLRNVIFWVGEQKWLWKVMLTEVDADGNGAVGDEMGKWGCQLDNGVKLWAEA
ncbi:hypothetical protein PLEOSDRAFT_1107018 [Pleurotus ostreatus PC15]|uniref:F-box domain-containing protein n=1 Tax=Pleurotus ostreatus (strain PC15) TaxID=1137138 RepID=A0A067NPX9_PLEO1|nr:hypothetical protein PLEOSDRAFT_1107018 [Pleurotus ostreatus PC15]